MASKLESNSDSNFHGLSLNKTLIIGIILNMVFVVTEFGIGLWENSLALLSDAGHNMSDVISLVLALLAFHLSRIKSNDNYTYGYKKSTVIVSLLNAIILLVAVGFIFVESCGKLNNPPEVSGKSIAWVASIGILINGLTAYFLSKGKDKDLNVKGAYLHMAADTLVSIGVVISGLIINWTGFYIIDPIIGIIVAIVILFSTWNLLRDSIRLSLDGVPVGIDIKKVYEIIERTHGVNAVHHLHIWPISTTEVGLTVHIVSDDISRMDSIKQSIIKKLMEYGITHSTLEFETIKEHLNEKQNCCCS